ncbi:NepR family anti-sigma factor [Ponticaulis profundi]|uniref:NepR family anti-sigma factor n=2 Tax=Ponticaulis profundi TaxID=2665222 RepID=A0ABW1SEA1_9PROT
MTSRRSRQKRLGDQLKRMYDDVVQEAVPDDFMKLLEDADKAGGGADSDKSASGDN